MTAENIEIFLVDDDPGLLDLLRHLVKKRFSGIGVTTVSDGSKVRELLGEKTPAVIVTDVLMPGMSGVELMYMLQGDEKYSGIKVIAMTGLEHDDARIEAVKSAGLFRIVYKETAFTENLLNSVEAALKSGAQADEFAKTSPGDQGELYEGVDEEGIEAPLKASLKREPKVFNYESVLESMDGDFEMLRIAVKTFLATCEFVMEQLEEGVRGNDSQTAARAAHTMAGAAGSIGGEKLKNACSETEAAILKNGCEASKRLIELLKSEYEALIETIKKTI